MELKLSKIPLIHGWPAECSNFMPIFELKTKVLMLINTPELAKCCSLWDPLSGHCLGLDLIVE